jgi:hypothetical protein
MSGWFFDDDICWCGNSDICNITECFRHMSNRKPQTPPDIFTQAAFMNTPDCPYYEEQGEDNDEI